MNRTRAALHCDADSFVCDNMGSPSAEPEAGLGNRAQHRLLVEYLVRVGLSLCCVNAA